MAAQHLESAPEDTTASLEAAIGLPQRLSLEAEDGQRHPLPAPGDVVIGASPNATLRITDPFVSQRHALVQWTARGPTVTDLGSKNGTWVDGVRISAAYLRAGSVLRVGRVRFLLVASRQPSLKAQELEPTSSATLRLLEITPSTRALLPRLRRLAPLRHAVLIGGESGTGKELIARALHDLAPRNAEPFVALNCAAIPDGLAESELFGHVRGAFSGAVKNHVGAFERAGAGTLFLDEVAELPLVIQAKLLRILESGRFHVLGGEREVMAHARIIAATHRDLGAMVADGLFREDLFHRLAVFTVELAPLRERAQDIPPLLHHFVEVAAAELGRSDLVLHPSALAQASTADWPGNVRGLRNAVIRAAALGDGPIRAQDLLVGIAPPPPRAESGPDVAAQLRDGGPTPSSQRPWRAVQDELVLPPAPRQQVGVADAYRVPRGSWAEMHHALLRQVLAAHGSVRRAAVALGIPRSTLSNWLSRPAGGDDNADDGRDASSADPT